MLYRMQGPRERGGTPLTVICLSWRRREFATNAGRVNDVIHTAVQTRSSRRRRRHGGRRSLEPERWYTSRQTVSISPGGAFPSCLSYYLVCHTRYTAVLKSVYLLVFFQAVQPFLGIFENCREVPSSRFCAKIPVYTPPVSRKRVTTHAHLAKSHCQGRIFRRRCCRRVRRRGASRPGNRAGRWSVVGEIRVTPSEGP